MKTNKSCAVLFLTILLLLTSVSFLYADEISPGTPLNIDDNFGSSVAVFDQWAMVGAIGDSDYAGKVYVFRGDSAGGWTFFSDLTGRLCQLSTGECGTSSIAAESTCPNDYFGKAIDIFGNVAVVGSSGRDTRCVINNAGAAYLLQWDGIAWRDKFMLRTFDAINNADYGASVGIYDEFVIVGAPGAYGEAGAVYVYQKPVTGWQDVWLEEDETQLLSFEDATKLSKLTVYDFFGASVAISDKYAVAGAYGDDQSGNRAGAVYVFHLDGEEWKPLKKLLPTAENPEGDKLGASVAMDGNFFVAGAPGANGGTGLAYVFSYDEQKVPDEQWNVAKIIPESGVSGFGTSVAINGNYIAVGVETGQAAIYKKSDDGAGNVTWALDGNFPEDSSTSGSISEIDISPSGGAYHFIGGIPEMNANQGAAYTTTRDIFQPGDTIFNTPPKFYDIDPQVLRTGAALSLKDLPVWDLETPRNELTIGDSPTFVVESGDLTQSDLFFSVNGLDLNIQSESTNTGTATVTVQAEDTCVGDMATGSCPKSSAISFLLTVADIPEIKIVTPPEAIIMNQLREGESDRIIVDFEVVNPGAMQTMTATSSDQNLVPDGNLIIDPLPSQTVSLYTLDIIPNELAFGRATITISATANDGTIVNASFLAAVNSLPEINELPETRTEIIKDGSYTLEVPFSVSDFETAASELTVEIDSNYSDPDQILLAGEAPSVTPSAPVDGSRKLLIPVKAKAVGNLTLTLIVSDKNSAQTTSEFTLKLVYSTDTTINGIWEEGAAANPDTNLSGKTIAIDQGEEGGSKSLFVRISDGDTPIEQITKTFTASQDWATTYQWGACNAVDSPDAPSSYDCALSIFEPLASTEIFVDALITISADDGDAATSNDQKTFYLTYNTPPTIEPAEGETFFDGVTMPEDSETQIFNLVIGDDAVNTVDDYNKMTKTFTASNNLFLGLDVEETEVPPYELPICENESAVNCYQCVASDCQIRIKPEANKFGSTKIAAEVVDEDDLAARRTFNVTVEAENDPPTLTIPAPFSINEDDSAITIKDISVADFDGDELSLSFTINAATEALVPNALPNVAICEETGTDDDPSCSDDPTAAGWYSLPSTNEPYILQPDEADSFTTTSLVKLFIKPAKDANSELYGPGVIEVSVADGDGAVAKKINFTVKEVADPPELVVPGGIVPIDDNLDRATAENAPISLEISHPDGQRDVTVTVSLPDGDDATGRAIPVDAQHAYFIDNDGVVTNAVSISETTLQGDALSLGLVLVPEPNEIDGTQYEKFEVVVANACSQTPCKSSSKIITAEVTPVNDPPVIDGLEASYPWEQEEQGVIPFTVIDPDLPNDSVYVEATWASGVNTTGAYTDGLISSVGDGTASVDLVVRPPDLLSGPTSLTVTVSDGEAEASETITLNIQKTNYPPEIEPYPDSSLSSLSTKEEKPVTLELWISDVDTENLSDLVLIKEWRSPNEDDPVGTFTGGEINNEGYAALTITPPDNWPKGPSGTEAAAEIVLNVREPDGTRALEPLIITLNVQALPDPPRLSPVEGEEPLPAATIREGGVFFLDFRLEDPDGLSNVTIEDPPSYDPGTTGLELQTSRTCQSMPGVDDQWLCTLTAKGVPDTWGEATITLKARESDTFLSDTLLVPLIVEKTDEPSAFQITGANPPSAFRIDSDTEEKYIVTNEDELVTVNYEIVDPDDPAGSSQVVTDSLKWIWTATTTPTAPVELELVPQGNYIKINPTQNGFGKGAVVLQVAGETETFSANFDVEIAPVNDYPTIEFTNPPVDPVDENTVVNLDFTVSDIETPSVALTLRYPRVGWVENNIETPLSAKDHILVTGTGENRILKFNPPDVCSANGATAIIRVEVEDVDEENGTDPRVGSDEVAIDYVSKSQKPTITKKNGLFIESIDEDSGAHYVDFIVERKPECRPATLLMNAPVLSNPDLVENAFFSDIDASTRRLTLVPVEDKSGETEITVSVVDASTEERLESDPLSFTFKIEPIPDPPTISVVMKGTSTSQVTQIPMEEGQTTADLPPEERYVIEVDDVDTLQDDLIMGAAWAPVSGKDFVEGEIRFERIDGSETLRKLVITPEEFDSGYARITPWVKDSPESAPVKSKPFELYVESINNPPMINAVIPDNTVYTQSDKAYELRFQVLDVDTPFTQVAVTAKSDNTQFLPETDPGSGETRFDWGRIDQPYDAMTHWLKMKPKLPVGTTSASIQVSILANDGNEPSQFDFTLVVGSDANPPEIAFASGTNEFTIFEDQTTPKVVEFQVLNVSADPQNVSAVVYSKTPDLIPDGLISDPAVNQTGNWQFEFRPAPDAPFGTSEAVATLGLRVSVDSGLPVDDEVVVTIRPLNDAPEIATIAPPPQTINRGQSFTAEFEVDDVDEESLGIEAKAEPDVATFQEDGSGNLRTVTVTPDADFVGDFKLTVTVKDNSGMGDNPSRGEPDSASKSFTISVDGVAPGDVDGNGTIDLGDVITALQVMAGIQASADVEADIDNDGRIGFVEALNALTHVANQ